MRRATNLPVDNKPDPRISTHALHAESDAVVAGRLPTALSISTHALHAESDAVGAGRLPTALSISTHALHAESDESGLRCAGGFPYFYPRSPCGERLAVELT